MRYGFGLGFNGLAHRLDQFGSYNLNQLNHLWFGLVNLILLYLRQLDSLRYDRNDLFCVLLCIMMVWCLYQPNWERNMFGCRKKKTEQIQIQVNVMALY